MTVNGSSSCPGGHPLIRVAVSVAGLQCDVCGANVPAGDATYSCEPCDYDDVPSLQRGGAEAEEESPAGAIEGRKRRARPSADAAAGAAADARQTRRLTAAAWSRLRGSAQGAGVLLLRPGSHSPCVRPWREAKRRRRRPRTRSAASRCTPTRTRTRTLSFILTLTLTLILALALIQTRTRTLTLTLTPEP